MRWAVLDGRRAAQFLTSSGVGRRLSEQRALAAWNAALGPQLAARARALRLRDGELLVDVDSATLLQELRNFTGEALRRSVNQRLGAEQIRLVSFQPRRLRGA